MSMEEFLPNLDLHEPILLKWALTRLDHLRETDAAKADDLEQRLFTDDAVGRLIENSESTMLLSRLFRILSIERFSGHLATIVQRWPEWGGQLAENAAVVIARIDADAAEKLFREFITSADNPFQDSRRWAGVRKGLDALPWSAAAPLAADALDHWMGDRQEQAEFSEENVDALDLAWHFHDPRCGEIFRETIVAAISEGEESIADELRPIALAIGVPESEYNLVMDVLTGHNDVLPSQMSAFYRDDLDLEALDDAIGGLALNKTKKAELLIREHGALFGDERIPRLFQDLIDDSDVMEKLHPTNEQPFVYGIFVAGLCGALRKSTLDLTSLTVDAVADLLIDDSRDLLDPDAFIAYFRQADPDETIRCLRNRRISAKSYFGGAHIVRTMGELGYDAFLEDIFDVISDEDFIYAPISLEIEPALLRYGERAIAFCDENYKRMDEAVKIQVLWLAAAIPGEPARRFLESRLNDLWRIDKELVIEAGMALVSDAVLNKIRKVVGKGQHLIDEAFLTISLLRGDRAAVSDDLLTAYYRDEKTIEASFEAVLRGDELSPTAGDFKLELTCGACGEDAYYGLHRIVLGENGEALPTGDIACVHCGEVADFEVTQRGKAAISVELMRLRELDKEEFLDAVDRTPMDLTGRDYLGPGRDLAAGMRTYQEGIRRHPSDPTNYLGLGFICHFLEREIRAAEYLEKTVRLDPAFVQAYYLLADIAESEAGPMAALNQLKRGLPHLKTWKYVPLGKGTQQTFVSEYCTYYNEVIEETGLYGKRLAPADFGSGAKKKVGRNDPCPCGSGKKYKKCCLR